MNEFTIHLVSSASMSIFPENALANLKNFFNEEISLEDDWRVALSEIMFPSRINHVNSTRIIKYSSEGNKTHQRSIPTGAVSKPYKGETVLINAGSFENLEHLIKAIKTATGLNNSVISTIKSQASVLVLFFLAKMKELYFLTKKYQAFWALEESNMAQALILVIKW